MQINDWLGLVSGSKIIITDKVRNGNRLLRKCNIEYRSDIVGARCVTLKQIAEEFLVAQLALKDSGEMVTILPADACTFIMDDILHSNEFSFLPEECQGVRTSAEILKSINQLRMNEGTDEFDSKEGKVKDIKKIISLYEDRLTGLGQYDEPGLLKKVYDELCDMSKDDFLMYMPWFGGKVNIGILENYECTRLEERLIDKIKEYSDAECVSTLEFYTKKEQPREVNYEFFKTYGVANEVEYVADRIVRNKLQYGDVTILYTSDEYEPFIQGTFESRGIPCNFITGKHILHTEQMQFVLSILEWAKSDFLYEKLAFVADNPQMSFGKIIDSNNEGANKSPADCYNGYLRQGIGWGKERYAECVKRINEDEEAGKKYIYFNKFLTELTEVFRNGRDCGAVFEALVELCGNYLRNGRENNTFRLILKEQIPVFKQAGEQKSEEECLQLISEHLKQLTTGGEEKDNEISVIKINRLEVLERKHNFVIGLSAKQLAAADTKESPVLSDKELERYVNGKLKLAKNAGIEVRQNLENSFATLSSGHIIMGYSMYDTVELRESSPSVLYLDYFDKYGKGEQEYYTYKVLKNAITIDKTLIEDRVKDYKAKKEQEKKDEEAMPDEGEDVACETEEACVEGIKMSASALQVLLACPFKYYYQYVEWLPNREFLEKKESDWLNPAKKGNLFHYTMEKYCEHKMGRDEISSDKPDREAFDSFFAEAADEILKEIPYTVKSVYEYERDAAKEQIWDFLCGLQKSLYDDNVNEQKWRILGNELKFSELEYSVSDTGADVTAADEKSIKLLFDGSIDRLDGYMDAEDKLHLRIVDYKTGKKDKLEKKVDDDIQIQHYIYAMAAMRYVNENKDELSKLFGQPVESVEIESVQYVFPYEAQGNQTLEVIEQFGSSVNSGKYTLPVSVAKAIWTVLGKTQDLSVAEKKKVLEDLIKEKEEGKIELPCQYCSYGRVCSLGLGM